MNGWLLTPVLCSVLYYLGSRATITRAIWSRYPKWLDSFLLCASCSGFWYGLVVATIGNGYLGFSYSGVRTPSAILLIGLCSAVWTPILSYIHIRALDGLEGSDDRSADE